MKIGGMRIWEIIGLAIVGIIAVLLVGIGFTHGLAAGIASIMTSFVYVIFYVAILVAYEGICYDEYTD